MSDWARHGTDAVGQKPRSALVAQSNSIESRLQVQGPRINYSRALSPKAFAEFSCRAKMKASLFVSIPDWCPMRDFGFARAVGQRAEPINNLPLLLSRAAAAPILWRRRFDEMNVWRLPEARRCDGGW